MTFYPDAGKILNRMQYMKIVKNRTFIGDVAVKDIAAEYGAPAYGNL